MDLKEWIAPKYADPRKFAAQYKKAKPFAHISLKGFLREEKARMIELALQEQQFTHKESDLFKLAQTNDFQSVQDETLQSFRALLASPEFSLYLTTLTGVALRNDALDMGGSLYADTDFLLCHDDQVTGRKIAYIFYMCQNFKSADGGALVLMSAKGKQPGKITKRYLPSWNTLNMFSVSSKSWHAVEEVMGEKKRYSINGWFH